MKVMYPRCAGLDVHLRQVTACVRIATGRKATTEHREFATTTAGLYELAVWLSEAGCTHVAMEATGVYWKPVWHMYAEVRGRLLGRGVDGEADSDDGAKLAALRPDAYRRQRGNAQGVGAATAKTLLRLWEKVPESIRVEMFPELASAASAARLLSSQGLPEGMEFDRLVVDEAQDLTLTEFWMLLELLRACRQRTGKSPWLLMAGDAGQRLRVGTLHRVAEQPLA